MGIGLILLGIAAVPLKFSKMPLVASTSIRNRILTRTIFSMPVYFYPKIDQDGRN